MNVFISIILVLLILGAIGHYTEKCMERLSLPGGYDKAEKYSGIFCFIIVTPLLIDASDRGYDPLIAIPIIISVPLVIIFLASFEWIKYIKWSIRALHDLWLCLIGRGDWTK